MDYLFNNATLDAYNGNLQGAWKLDENSGTRYDVTDNGNDLTDNNTVGYAAGKDQNCADFELSNSESLSITDAAQTGLNITGSITISAWIRMESLNSYSSVCAKFDTNGDQRGYSLQVHSAGEIRFGLSPDGTSGNGVTAVSSNTVSTGTWYHIFAVYNGSTIKAYINNSEWASENYSSGIFDTSAGFRIGGRDNGGGGAGDVGDLFDGRIDELYVWDTALSSAARGELYNNGAGTTLSYIYRFISPRLSAPVDKVPPAVLVW